MKARKFFVLAGALLLAFAGLTSCNKDDIGKDGDRMVGKYEIKDASSPIKSIELTSDGEYIVTKNPAVTKADDDLDLNDVWAYGKFTFVNGAYVLQGFGQIIINLLGDSEATISIDSGGWDPFTVDAHIASTVQETKINKALCRHWVFEKTHFSLAYNDLTFLDFELDGCNFSRWLQDSGDQNANDDLDEECTGLIFTESGTYAVVYDNGKINVGSWSWENTENGSLKCDWSTQYQSFFKDYRFQGSLVVDVEEGDPATCTVIRSFESTMEKYRPFIGSSYHSLSTTLTYYLTEYK
ncbi:MAG: hypothetical protein IKG84_04060 [Bacteroidales bacterium]|nr:hypothetical protein [Bacteroidales bacterium]